MMDHILSDKFFNFSGFLEGLTKWKDQYEQAKPYPYIELDGLFNEELLDEAVKAFPEKTDKIWDIRNDPEIQVKYRTNWQTEADIPPSTLMLVQILNSGRFIRMLSTLTGIPGLIPDYYFTGGGLNQIFRNGELAIHVDGTISDQMQLYRRINVILFLNRNWQDEWGGHLELWDEKKTRCEARIKPDFNKLAIFTTNDKTYHGHPHPLTCPEDQSRKSLILYYYTATRPESEVVFDRAHRALFTKRSDLPKV
ncbi:MAG: 2OG-Fe(II) oxygenase [Bdellovibrionales bacterium]